jgi:hypothetical protein
MASILAHSLAEIVGTVVAPPLEQLAGFAEIYDLRAAIGLLPGYCTRCLPYLQILNIARQTGLLCHDYSPLSLSTLCHAVRSIQLPLRSFPFSGVSSSSA